MLFAHALLFVLTSAIALANVRCARRLSVDIAVGGSLTEIVAHGLIVASGTGSARCSERMLFAIFPFASSPGAVVYCEVIAAVQ